MRVLASGVAFLVDMDGTLVDSTAVVEAVWREFSAAHGLDPAAVLAHAHGRQAVSTIGRFLPELDEAARSRLAAELLAEETGRTDGIDEVPGAAALLARLAELGAPVALVTSATEGLARVRMAAAGVPWPSVAVTAQDVTRGKPDPEGFLVAAARLNVDPRRAVALEDSGPGLRAALGSGARVVAVGGTTTAAPRPAPGGALVARIPDFAGLDVVRDADEYALTTR